MPFLRLCDNLSVPKLRPGMELSSIRCVALLATIGALQSNVYPACSVPYVTLALVYYCEQALYDVMYVVYTYYVHIVCMGTNMCIAAQ